MAWASGGDWKTAEEGWKKMVEEKGLVGVASEVRRSLCFSSVEGAMASVVAEPQTVRSGTVAA